jgi:hypothetical protein
VFRHVVLLTIDPGAPAAAVPSIVEGLRELPALIPSLRSYTVGVDVGLAEGNATIAVVADFDDDAGYLEYRDHPAHQQVIADRIRPVLAGRSAVQHDLP